MNHSNLVKADHPFDQVGLHDHERTIHTFPVFPGSDQDFSIDWGDFNAVYDLLADMGVKYKLTQLQLMVKIMQEDPQRRVYKLFMPKYENITFLPSSIGRLTNLRGLFLVGKRCRGLRSLPSSIGDLKSLEHLSLRDSGIASLPSSIGKLKNLRVLDLANTENLSKLPREIGKLLNLRVLKIKGSGIDWLPPSLFLLKNLRSYYLQGFVPMIKKSSNPYSESSSVVDEDQIRRWIPFSTKNLDLSYTRADHLLLHLRRLRNLKSLDLSFTKGVSSGPPRYVERDYDDDDEYYYDLIMYDPIHYYPINVGHLASEVGDLLSLEKLNLSHSNVHYLFPSIGCLTNLKELDLSMTRYLRPVLPEMIGNLSNLEKLNLSYSNVMGLPSSIGRLQKLKELDLYKSRIQELSTSIWREFNGMKSLEILRCNSPTFSSLRNYDKKLYKRACETNKHWEFENLVMPLAGFWIKYTAPHKPVEASGLVHFDFRGSRMNSVWNTFEGLKRMIDCIPSLESIVISTEQIEEELYKTLHHTSRKDIMPLLEHTLHLLKSCSSDEERLLVGMICKQEERKLRLYMASRNGSCWALPGLWPHKLQHLTSGIDDCEYSDRKKRLLRRLEGSMAPTIHEADLIFHFLRSTVGITPNYLQKALPPVGNEDNTVHSDDPQDANNADSIGSALNTVHRNEEAYDADCEYDPQDAFYDADSISSALSPVYRNDINPEASALLNPRTKSKVIGWGCFATALSIALMIFLGLGDAHAI